MHSAPIFEILKITFPGHYFDVQMVISKFVKVKYCHAYNGNLSVVSY